MIRSLALPFALLALAGCELNSSTEIKLDAVDALDVSVQNQRGDVIITSVDGTDAVVTWAADGDITSDDFVIAAVMDGETVSVSLVLSNDSVEGDVNVTVSVPAGLDFSVQATEGDVDMDVDIADDGSVSVQAGAGDIAVTAQADLNADVSATAMNGSVDFPGYDFDGETLGGIASGTIGDGGADISLVADSGSISLGAR